MPPWEGPGAPRGVRRLHHSRLPLMGPGPAVWWRGPVRLAPCSAIGRCCWPDPGMRGCRLALGTNRLLVGKTGGQVVVPGIPEGSSLPRLRPGGDDRGPRGLAASGPSFALKGC